MTDAFTHMDYIHCMYQMRGLLGHGTNIWRFGTKTNVENQTMIKQMKQWNLKLH